ncbi:MAG: quinone-dependent dihydroorotate dehydrogenase [Gammaproteobacteria bacterium]
MNAYSLLRPVLFSLDPETAHNATLKLLNFLYITGFSSCLFRKQESASIEAMGMSFDNVVGLAAGLDKNGDYIDALAALGFGFIEIGTVTPRPQPGNPKPRLYRLPEHNAIINRMGFNNKGVDHLVERVRQAKFTGILGINIGKNFDTPIENALDDYLICLKKVYPHAGYVTINISSPNTKNLRQLQQGEDIKILLAGLKKEQRKLHELHQKYVPLVLKIAPDLTRGQIDHIAELLLEFKMDGVIATNTTVDRDMIAGHPLAGEAGGLSGSPVKEKSTAVVKSLSNALKGKIPIIAAGGILDAADAQEKLDAGASLVQIYSGLIYQGPFLIQDIIRNCRPPGISYGRT